MKWLDLPPNWLAGCVIVTWIQAGYVPLIPSGFWLKAIGGALFVASVVLVLFAVLAFRTHRTTIIPHQAPARMITSGPYRLSRNPIYLADLGILLSLSLYWAAPLGVLLVPVLGWILTRRFILPEERRLASAFPDAFGAYCKGTRRWI